MTACPKCGSRNTRRISATVHRGATGVSEHQEQCGNCGKKFWVNEKTGAVRG